MIVVYEIKTNDLHGDFYEDRDLLDFWDFGDSVNKKVNGKMKDEVGGNTIDEFV